MVIQLADCPKFLALLGNFFGMFYFIVLVVLLVLVVLFFSYKNKQDRQKKKEELLNQWGRPLDISRSFNLVSAYHFSKYHEHSNDLSDTIADDIDLENLFEYVDRSHSSLGRQYLYHQLRTKQEVGALQELDALSESFAVDPKRRIDAAVELSQLNHKNAYYIYELFTSSYQSLYSKGLNLYVRAASVLWLAFLALLIVYKSQFFFLGLLGLTLFNFYLHYNNKKKISRYVHSLPQLYTLINTTKSLLKLGHTPKATAVTQSLNNLRPLQRSLSYVNFQNNVDRDPTDISAGILELVKTLLLIEPLMFLISVDRINQQRHNIETLFNYVAEIDLAISIQSLRTGLPYYCKPKLVPNGEELKIEALYHPLIDDCVANSITASTKQGVLITGSNMSGKTTFIRSIAINALLAQTLYTSCSQHYEAPFMQLFTSVRNSDDLEEHKSYFKAEALAMLHIIENSKALQSRNLIIIDEIFKGTNTIERVAGAKAILSYLNAHQNFTFVSTHDLELAELLGEEYAVYSFEEVVADTRLVFDYKIKPGLLKNKNAIAILSSLGFPPEIVANANEISTALREKYQL